MGIVVYVRFKIDKTNLPQVIMWSFTTIFSIFGFVITLIIQDKKEDRKKMREMIDAKADCTDFNLFKNFIEKEMLFYNETLQKSDRIVEEVQTKVEKIYDCNLKHNEEILTLIQNYIKKDTNQRISDKKRK